MARVGINLPGDGSIPHEEVFELGAKVVRYVAHRQQDNDWRMRWYAETFTNAGVGVVLVIASESFAGFATWEEAFAYYREYYRGIPVLWQVANEWDNTDPNSDSSWRLDKGVLNHLLFIARSYLGEDAYIILGGMVSGQPGAFDGVALKHVNAVAVHPYGRCAPDSRHLRGCFFGEDVGLVQQVRKWLDDHAWTHIHLHVTEEGWPTRDTAFDENIKGALTGYAVKYWRDSDLVGDWIHFCTHEYAGFGMYTNGERNASWYEFQAGARGYW